MRIGIFTAVSFTNILLNYIFYLGLLLNTDFNHFSLLKLNLYKYLISYEVMKITLLAIGISLIMSILVVAVAISPSAMARITPMEPKPTCSVSYGSTVECCQSFSDPSGANAKVYCTLCKNTDPPSDCSDRYEPPNSGSAEHEDEVNLPDANLQNNLNLSVSN